MSYSRFDAERVAPIAKLINDDRPVWYDEGLVAGQEWEKMIIEQVKGCKAAAFFVSRDLLGRDKSYVCDEFRFATEHGKPALCVLLDDVSDLTPSDAMRDLWDGLQKLPAVSVYDKPTDTEKAQAVLVALDALERKAPAPSTDLPKSEPNPTPKAEPKPEGGFAKFLGSKLFKAAVAIPIAAALAVGGTVAARHFLGNDDDITSYPRVEEIQSVDDIVEEDIVVMGEFDGKPIEWLVLDKKDDDVLLITKEPVCAKKFDDRPIETDSNGDLYPYKSAYKKNAIEPSDTTVIFETYFDVNWENCSLRKWLNGEFINQTFTSSEIERINFTTVTTPDFTFVPNENFQLLNNYTFDGGADTVERIFLLSVDEYERYFPFRDYYIGWLRSPGGQAS
ncbi:MAG: toll/interleukin-1 receptor domain-containing protein, partial [Clostridia bacterium]|nr:toll/interleukin-1 receptor domain-containing protein [Clostridia bacterium]